MTSVLLVAAGSNSERLRNESAFAAMCGVSPILASSGQTNRHRLNRSGNRQANNALWRIATVRMTCDEETTSYLAKRMAEGKTKRDVTRCLKRHIAREVFFLLQHPEYEEVGPQLRMARKSAHISLQTVSETTSGCGRPRSRASSEDSIMTMNSLRSTRPGSVSI